MTAKAGIDVGT